MENEGIMKRRVKDFSKGIDIMQTILIFLIALLVPTFLGGILSKIFGSTSVISTNSQLIIGTIKWYLPRNKTYFSRTLLKIIVYHSKVVNILKVAISMQLY